MSRISGIEASQAEGYTAAVLKSQRKTWGAPLNNHLIYARRPGLFKAVRGMWTAIDSDGHIGPALLSLINRRVASHNGCVF
ncbi:MAG: hypothetical protein ACC642_00620 [Pseudomonadales bacterium]